MVMANMTMKERVCVPVHVKLLARVHHISAPHSTWWWRSWWGLVLYGSCSSTYMPGSERMTTPSRHCRHSRIWWCGVCKLGHIPSAALSSGNAMLPGKRACLR